MKIYRDGKYFAEGDDLRMIAEVSGEDPSRYSFDLGELRELKRNQMILAANADYRAIFTRDGAYVELEKDYILFRRAFGLTLTIPQQTQATQARAVVEKLQTILLAVNAAATEADVLLVIW